MRSQDNLSTLDPFELFDTWLTEAEKEEINDPNAMALATMDKEGRPSVRIVLMRERDDDGFVFYTNRESRKGEGLSKHPQAELCFYWKSLRKQIRITGPVSEVSDARSDAYFGQRPRGSKIGAWASQQSRPMDSYEDLQRSVDEFEAKFDGQNDIPRPPYWGGYKVTAERIEFWQDQKYRLHKRFVFIKNGDSWDTNWLYP